MKNNSNMRWLNDSDSDASNTDSGLARPVRNGTNAEGDESEPSVEKKGASMNETVES